MKPIDYETRKKLRELAKVATPGPWNLEKGDHICEFSEEDAKYMSTLSPDVVLNLLDNLEQTEEFAQQMQDFATDACLELQAENEELKNMLGKGPYVPLHQYDLLQEQFEEIKKKNSVLVKEHKDATTYMAKKHEEYVECIDRAYFNDKRIADLELKLKETEKVARETAQSWRLHERQVQLLEKKLKIAKKALAKCRGSDTRALVAAKALEEIKEIKEIE